MADPDTGTAVAETRPAWTGRSHGGGLGTAVIWWFIRCGGRDVCYLVVTVPALWFWLRDGRTRRAIAGYWRRIDPRLSEVRAQLRALRHLWEFARTLADRLIAARQPRALRYEQVGLEHLVAPPGTGVILLSAHLGSFELAARWLAQGGAMLNLVMLDGEDPRVRAQLARVMGGRPYRVIDLRDPAGAGLELVAALGRGETCCMLGDRTAGGAAGTVAVPFLGGLARFPMGPFVAAAVTGARIVPTFCVRRRWAVWRCVALPPYTVDLGPRAGRQERLRAVVATWAATVEAQVRESPWAWNNYYDFWAEAEPTVEST